MIYKQTTPMQWITFYYNGNDKRKIEKARSRQMLRQIRYSNVIEEIQEEGLETLFDSKSRFVGMTDSGLIVMFENNL